jgi:hypothetical protein
MPPPVAAGHAPRRVGITGHVLLNGLDRPRPAGPFLRPEHRRLWGPTRPLRQALTAARDRGRREIAPAILAAFALLDEHRLLGPVDGLPLPLGHLRHP